MFVSNDESFCLIGVVLFILFVIFLVYSSFGCRRLARFVNSIHLLPALSIYNFQKTGSKVAMRKLRQRLQHFSKNIHSENKALMSKMLTNCLGRGISGKWTCIILKLCIGESLNICPFLKNKGDEAPKGLSPITFQEWTDTRTFSDLNTPQQK